MFRQVLVAVDGTDRDTELVRYAQVLLRLSPDVRCEFIHVLGWQGRLPPGTPPVTHQQALRHLEDKVTRHFGDGYSGCRVVPGNLVDCLLEATLSTRADLLMVGHRESTGGRRALARRLAMKAPCSVWVRPNEGPTDVRRVLVAVDFSKSSAEALSVAARIAAQANGGAKECLALHAYFSGGIAGGEEDRRIEERTVRADFDRFLAPLDTHGVQVKALVEESANVVHAIQAVAEREKADLIVMGNRGQARSASILLGSESEHMLMESRMPVLIVKRQGERIGLLKALLDREFHTPDALRFG